ncbi:MAG: hypothetical protein ABFR53_12785 [Actinomycetota bacterium]
MDIGKPERIIVVEPLKIDEDAPIDPVHEPVGEPAPSQGAKGERRR